MGDLSLHFSRREFACPCGCGFDTVDHELIVILERIRAHFNLPVHVTSGCRCSAYNAVVGGARDSQHMRGRAADIHLALPPDTVRAYLLAAYPERFGIGGYKTFTHIDTRGTVARW